MTDGSGPGAGAPRGAAGRKQLRRRILDLEPGPTSRGRPQKRRAARVQDGESGAGTASPMPLDSDATRQERASQARQKCEPRKARSRGQRAPATPFRARHWPGLGVMPTAGRTARQGD